MCRLEVLESEVCCFSLQSSPDTGILGEGVPFNLSHISRPRKICTAFTDTRHVATLIPERGGTMQSDRLDSDLE